MTLIISLQNLSFMGDNKFDVTLCLAFIHHLTFSNGFTLERVRDTLVNVTNQHLIIEFVDRSDEYVSQWINPFFDWYNQANFEHVFEQCFVIEDKQKNFGFTNRLFHEIKLYRSGVI